MTTAAATETISGRLLLVRAERGAWFAGELEVDAGRIKKISGNCSPIPRPGSILTLSGTTEVHLEWGPQFKFKTILKIELPSDREGVVRYLCSFTGIGPVAAEKIYAALGQNAAAMITADPSILDQIKGLGKKAVAAAEQIKADASNAALMTRLHSMKFGERTIEKAIKEFGDGLEKLLAHNPYKLIKLDRVGFAQIDNAVMELNQFPINSPFRAAAAIVHAIKEQAGNGHTWVSREELSSILGKLKLTFPVPEDAIEPGIASGVKNELLVRVNGDAGLAVPWLAEAEEFIAERINALGRSASLFGSVEKIKAEVRNELTFEQFAAVLAAVESPVSILTGGPGTGKTYATNAILDALGRSHCIILAPTGKAARRAHEVTGHQACTIHLYCGQLERQGDKEDGDGPENQKRVLIIDESSMVSVDVLAMLLRAATRKDLRIVFVGDVDQLPSVGPGRVLCDLIESGAVPVTRLTKIHRQAEGSAIIRNAHAINAGTAREGLTEKLEDWRFMTIDDDPEKTAAVIPRVMRSGAEVLNLDIRRDVQVLTGMHKGPLGVTNLNKIIRAELNPHQLGDVEIMAKGASFLRVGDKVLVTQNEYSLGVVNGDTGEVERVQPAGKDSDGKATQQCAWVRFDDGRSVAFEGESIYLLTQAWAMTVHKSQGSEYPLVIQIVDAQTAHLFGRAWLYTGVTRARRVLVLVGTKKALGIAVGNARSAGRKTRLAGLLKGQFCLSKNAPSEAPDA